MHNKNKSHASRRNFSGRDNSFKPKKNFYQRNNRSRFKPQKLDISKLIRKATPVEEQKHDIQYQFKDFKISEKLQQSIINKGYISPTPIQDQTIPLILEGKDMIGIANTGTGKTAAFLIPLIDKVLLNWRENVLIIVPTRELAVQIRDELISFTNNMNIRSVLCIGGADMRRQINQLHSKPNFVIATPGRLKDMVQRGHIRLENFGNIVLDEVDRMLDMGFYPEVKLLIDQMPKQKHALFFSATLNPKLEDLARNFLNNPEKISVKTQDTSQNVDQEVIKLNLRNKSQVLNELLIQEEFSKVLIFGRTKNGVEKLQEILIKLGHKADSIHGDKSQFKRQKALDSFKKGTVKILIATDVVARGLDIPNVTHVINYDMPATYEDYIHRIGRTGRGKNVGKALTLVD